MGGNDMSNSKYSPRVDLSHPLDDCTASPCERCHGHCRSDEECAGDLVCFQKGLEAKDNATYIPSCYGLDISLTDWCVVKDWVGPAGDRGDDGNGKGTGRGELMILAYYYTWYFAGDWSRHGLQGNIPQLGFYGTDDPAVAEQHNEWAVRAGIDAWIVSWWGQDHTSDDHFFLGMLRAQNLDKVKFCMLYERGALITNDFSDPRALQDITNDMKYFKKNFFGHPQYLHVNGDPVVVLYLTRGYLNFNRGMVKKIQQDVGVNIFFIADTPYFGYNANPFTARNGIVDGTPVFDAYTSYNMYTDPAVRDDESATQYMFREALPVYKRWAKEVTYFPQVLPMYHDFRDHPPLTGNATEMRLQLEEFACLEKPEGNKYPNMLFMTSWNEWWEGSQLEPDEAGRYSFTFIDELKRFKDAGPANC